MAITFNVGPTDVANEALAICCRDPITDIENPADPVAVKILQFYRTLLRAMLADHDWHWAKRRTALSWTGIAPASEWAYAYTLPPDCFRIIQINGSDRATWEMGEEGLLSNDSTMTIEYIQWRPDPNHWPGLFYMAFVTLLAHRLAPAFNSDVSKSSDLYQTYTMQNSDAKTVDGQSNTSLQFITCDDLTRLREGFE